MLGYSNIFQFLIAAVAILISVILHELAHGYVALWNGDATAKVYGRLTLNPLAHFDPFGLVMLFLVRFGYAKPVPINPDNFRKRKTGMLTVAFAGIVTNLILAFISTPFYLLCLTAKSAAVQAYLGGFFLWMMVININLALFNLLPIYPLDGYRVIESLTRATNPFNKFMRNYGQYVLICLVGISIIVSAIPPMPEYFDIIGMYISYFRSWIMRGFTAFWGLLF